MLAPYDSEYLEAKNIKKGLKTMPNQYLALAQWIQEKYAIKPLYIVYSTPNTVPTLFIIFEYEHEAAVLNRVDQTSIKQTCQKSILLKYLELSPQDTVEKTLKIASLSFRPIAIAEANDLIDIESLNSLKENFVEQVWEISRFMAYTTVFFYTQKQLAESHSNGLRWQFADAYFEILKLKDEFGYIHRDSLKIYFDSKENFDRAYHGNWYYYYK